MRNIDSCPSCNSTELRELFVTQDYFLTQEKFSICICGHCKLLITNPQPDSSDSSRYYLSENYISHSNEPKSAMDYVYILARKFAIRSKLKIISRFSHNYTILDFGCGTGDFLSSCKEKGWSVTGFEPSEIARNIASKTLGINILGSLTELVSQQRYSIITLWHVLEHVQDLNDTIEKLRNLMSDKGKLIFALPNHESYEARYYDKHWAAYDVPRHLYHFSKTSMNYLLSKHGLKLDEIIPMKMDSYYISLLSEKYKHSTSNYIKSLLTGYKSNIYANKSGQYSSLIYITSKC